jgi:signal transduction histidine kinase
MIRFSLRQRVLIILIGFVTATVFLGVVLVWTTYRMEELLASITRQELAAVQRGEALAQVLQQQKGLVAYHLLDGQSGWLEQQAAGGQRFTTMLGQLREEADDAATRAAVDELSVEYTRYAEAKAQVVSLYLLGEPQAGAALHAEAHRHFERLLERIDELKRVHTERMLSADAAGHAQARRLRLLAAGAVAGLIGLTLLLAFVFVYRIMEPLRRLTREAGPGPLPAHTADEVKTLSRRVRVLLQHIDLAQTELERSRESLAHAEKMALVGKLAAGMAHSIRNPFTSVKMRLFSLSRSLVPDEAQREDIEVISEEIRHIDTIVQNFLEFSRPPRLRMQPVSPSCVVDSTLRLLDQRLKSYGVAVRLDRPAVLPTVQADPEQLKEVMVNLVVNACEAMPPGGGIVIEERVARSADGAELAAVRVRDNGPGIPEHLAERIFDPFFSTKEQGTGLGLSIARRIIAEHGGGLQGETDTDGGAVFTLTLPVKEPPA